MSLYLYVLSLCFFYGPDIDTSPNLVQNNAGILEGRSILSSCVSYKHINYEFQLIQSVGLPCGFF